MLLVSIQKVTQLKVDERTRGTLFLLAVFTSARKALIKIIATTWERMAKNDSPIENDIRLLSS